MDAQLKGKPVSTRHHVVSRFYLRLFGDGEMVGSTNFVNWRTVSTRSVGWRPGFNTPPWQAKDPNVVEDALGEFENLAAPAVSKVQDMAVLTPEECTLVLQFVAVSMVRTPWTRGLALEVVNDSFWDGVEGEKEIRERFPDAAHQAKLIHLLSINPISVHVYRRLLQRRWRVVATPTYPLWTSDNPVCAVGAKSTIITAPALMMPMGRNCCLVGTLPRSLSERARFSFYLPADRCREQVLAHTFNKAQRLSAERNMVFHPADMGFFQYFQNSAANTGFAELPKWFAKEGGDAGDLGCRQSSTGT